MSEKQREQEARSQKSEVAGVRSQERNAASVAARARIPSLAGRGVGEGRSVGAECRRAPARLNAHAITFPPPVYLSPAPPWKGGEHDETSPLPYSSSHLLITHHFPLTISFSIRHGQYA